MRTRMLLVIIYIILILAIIWLVPAKLFTQLLLILIVTILIGPKIHGIKK